MARDEIFLRQCHQANLAVGSFGVINVDARDGHPLKVRLMVAADEEHRYTLQPGESFPVGDQTWKLDRVENPKGRNVTVVLARVEDVAPHTQGKVPHDRAR